MRLHITPPCSNSRHTKDQPHACAGTEGAGCEAHLTCARETAKRSGGVLDEKNVCGAVCSHGVPIKELFMTCQANENFSQYDAMLAAALLLGVMPELQTLLLTSAASSPDT